MITYAIRRTNPLSRWPYRIVRTRTPERGRITTHKLLRKFESHEQAHAYLAKFTQSGLIDRLA